MSQQSHCPDAPIAVCRDFFIKSKSVCAVPSGCCPRNWTLCGRRRATGKGNGCVLSSAKISLLFRIVEVYTRKCVHLSILRKEEQKHGDFFSTYPLFLSSLPLFLRSPSCFGEKSVAAFSLPSAFVPFPSPLLGAPSRMTPSHAGTRTRALRTQQVSTFLPSPITCNRLRYCSLRVKAFAFP